MNVTTDLAMAEVASSKGVHIGNTLMIRSASTFGELRLLVWRVCNGSTLVVDLNNI